MPTIRIEDLAIYYGTKKNTITALSNFFATFENGKITVLIGESGCGKTSLLKCITQSISYYGSIFIDDKNIIDLSVKELNISFVSQEFSLFPTMTVFENISFPLSNKHIPDIEVRRRVRSLAEKLNISFLLNRRIKELSIGQQQLVCIARAFVKEPTICLFDEPFSNLDKKLAYHLCSLLKELQKQFGTTVIFVTHDFNEAINLADYIVVMNNEGVEISGTANELLSSDNETIRYLLESAGHK